MASTPSTEERFADRWRDLSAQHARAQSLLERALKMHDLGVSEFEVLDRLAASAKDECRMLEIGGEVHLSQSALSRVVARLEKDGLVERGMCAEDRRGIFVCLTRAGHERWDAARPAQLAALREAFDS